MIIHYVVEKCVRDKAMRGFDFINCRRFYGDQAGERLHYSDEAIERMPVDLDDSHLPKVMLPKTALSIADDLEYGLKMSDFASYSGYTSVEGLIAYLRFWGTLGHPIQCLI